MTWTYNKLFLYCYTIIISWHEHIGVTEQRKKLVLDGQTPHCPICGLTLRPGEADIHFQNELEKLDKISIRWEQHYG